MKNYASLTDALADLKKRGYEADFTTEHFCLYCGDLDIRLHPETFEIDEVYRFEDSSCADDNSILYAISSPTGLKGTLVNDYGEGPDLKMSCELRNHLNPGS